MNTHARREKRKKKRLKHIYKHTNIKERLQLRLLRSQSCIGKYKYSHSLSPRNLSVLHCTFYLYYVAQFNSLSLSLYLPPQMLRCVEQRHLLHKQISFYSRLHVVYFIYLDIHTYIKAIQSATVFDRTRETGHSLCFYVHSITAQE